MKEELAGTDGADSVAGQPDQGEAPGRAAVDAVDVEIEIQIMETVLFGLLRQVARFGRKQMQHKGRF